MGHRRETVEGVEEEGSTREGKVEEEVSGGGLPPEQALRDPWCLKNRRQREKKKKKVRTE